MFDLVGSDHAHRFDRADRRSDERTDQQAGERLQRTGGGVIGDLVRCLLGIESLLDLLLNLIVA